MRHVMPWFVEAEVREHQLTGFAIQHEGEYARQVGFERQRHQIEHRRRVLFPRVGNAHGRPRCNQLARRLLLGALDATLDLAQVLEILIETHLVAGAEPALERRDVALH